MMELKKSPRRAAAASVAHVSTAQAITRCDLALYGVRDVLALRAPVSPHSSAMLFRLLTVARLVCLGKALLLHLLQSEVERALEHCRDVTVRNGMADQGLEKLELLFQGRACIELDAIAGFGRWFD
jgi:hypothetical protein